MNALIYLFQVSACMGIFYLFYYALLSRFTFFTINRWYLIVTLAMCFVIPLLTITVEQPESYPQVIRQVVYINNMQNFSPAAMAAELHTTAPEQITWMAVIKLFYLIVVALFALRLLVMIIKFFARVKGKDSTTMDGVRIVHGDDKLSNGSFFNFIFLSDDELSDDELQQIIAHEMLHVKLYHSVDRILVKIAQVFLWFNPFVYLYAKAIEENHEFEVDRAVSASTDRNQYAELLFHLSVARQGTLYHNFSMVPLKKRITMLFTKPTNRMKNVIYLLVVPLVLISCLAFANIKKEDIKKIDLVSVGKQLLRDFKSGQERVVQQLNQPVQLPVVINNADSANIAAKPLGALLTALNDTERFSSFGDISKDTKLIIDGKEYPNDLLYEISSNCFAEVNLMKFGNG